MIDFLKRKCQNLVSDKRFSEILTGSAWSLLAQIAAAGLGMVNSIIVARFYGADILGVVAILLSFLELTTIFTVLGTNTSVLRLIPEHLSKYSPTSAFLVYRKTQLLIAGFSLITGTILYISSDFIAGSIFSKKHLSLFFAIAAFFILFQSLVQLNTQAVRGLRLIKVFSFMQVLPIISKLIILVIITVFSFNQYNPVYAMFASITITALAGIWIMDRFFKKIKGAHDIVHEVAIHEILRLSFPMLMTSAMYFIIGQTGVIMLGAFASEKDIGYYSVAVRLAILATYIFQATATIAGPKFSELYHTGKIDELFHVAKKSTKLILLISTPIILTLLLFGFYILRYIYGPHFTVSYPSLCILLIGYSFSMASGPTGLFMDMTGNQEVFRNVMLLAATSNIVMNTVLIPIFGILGAASSATISLVLWNFFTLLYIKKKFGRTIGYIFT